MLKKLLKKLKRLIFPFICNKSFKIQTFNENIEYYLVVGWLRVPRENRNVRNSWHHFIVSVRTVVVEVIFA